MINKGGKKMTPNYDYNPRIYYVATFLVTYTLWLAGAYISLQDDTNGLYMLFMLLGLMAPLIISVVMIAKSNNFGLKRDFINRLINPRLIQLKMIPVLLLLMPLTILTSILISLPLGGSMAQFQFTEGFSFSSGFVPVLLLLFLAASFEELGWRGYAFDSLQSRYNLFTATILFSVLWSLWHFPLVFVNNSYQFEILNENLWFGVNFFVSIIPMGVIVSWFCIKNRKSIIIAILFHFIINISQEILAISQMTKCIETVVLILVAAFIVIFDRELFFRKENQIQQTCIS
jgi:hypothetical protein